MSGFLFIIPEGWTQIDLNAAYESDTELVKTNLESWIGAGDMNLIAAKLIAAGMIPAESAVVEARVFGEFFVVRLGQ